VSKTIKKNRLISAAALGLCLAFVLPGMSMAQAVMYSGQSDQTPDYLRPLKQALANAGATALTSDQETAIQTLITNFRTSTESTPSATRLAYDNDILTGNVAGAIALIPALNAEQAQQEQARQEAEISFAAAVVKALSSAQLSALQQKLGADDTVRLIQSLAGGPGGGHGGPPPAD